MNDPTAPPPNYGAATGQAPAYPQPGIAATQPAYSDAPPKYEPPKHDPSAQQYQGMFTFVF